MADDISTDPGPSPQAPATPPAPPEMETRNVVDQHGSVIGTMIMPVGTSEDVWSYQMSHYSLPAPTITLLTKVSNSIGSASDFGATLATTYAASNVLIGITQAGKTQVVADYLKDLSYYLHSGSLYAAIAEMMRIIADTSDDKTAVSPYVTNALVYQYMNKLQAYLCLPITPDPGS